MESPGNFYRKNVALPTPTGRWRRAHEQRSRRDVHPTPSSSLHFSRLTLPLQNVAISPVCPLPKNAMPCGPVHPRLTEAVQKVADLLPSRRLMHCYRILSCVGHACRRSPSRVFPLAGNLFSITLALRDRHPACAYVMSSLILGRGSISIPSDRYLSTMANQSLGRGAGIFPANSTGSR